MQTLYKSRGFTLIELVVVMVVVSILAAIALPSYTRYVTKSRRAAAEACLSNFANYMEVYYASNLRYANANGTAITLPSLDCASAQNTGNYYTYSLSVDTTTAYTVKAAAKSSQLGNDSQCANLTLDQSGARSTPSSCWAK